MSNSTTQKQRRAQRAREFLDALIQRYPDCLSSDPKAVKPLAIGTLEAITADLAKDPEWAETPKWLIRQSLAVYTRRPSYLRALAAGGNRINLDGSAAGEVNDDARAHAKKTLETREAEKPAPKRKPPRRQKPRRKQPASDATDAKLEALQKKFND